MSIDFDIKLTNEANYPLVTVQGELDLHTCPKLNDVLQEALATVKKVIILNLENASYMDSTALGTVARMAKSVDEKNAEVYVVCQKSHILKLFSISGLLKKNIMIFDSLEEAVKDV